ncbi:VanZ like family protein [Planctomycetes bacterium MalM25]|nr:VanZ like family protein [Planctomycetes bacterium MalM25]
MSASPDLKLSSAESFRTSNRRWLGVLMAYWTILFTATHIPAPEAIAGAALDYDKLIHASAYFLLTTLMLRAWRRPGGLLAGRGRHVVAAIAIAYGAFDEATQPFFNRVGDLADWLADSVGVTLAIGYDRWRSRRNESKNQ